MAIPNYNNDGTEVINIIRSQGWEHKDIGSEYILKHCFFCGNNTSHLYLQKSDGAYFCHKCGAKGSLTDLKRFLGITKESFDILSMSKALPRITSQKQHSSLNREYLEEMHNQLLASEEALAYLYAKGYNIETIKRFKIGYRKKKYDYENFFRHEILFPNLVNGIPVNIKFKTFLTEGNEGEIVRAKEFKQLADAQKVLYNSDCLDTFDEIIIAEGEIDVNILVQTGFENVVSPSQGARFWDDDWTLKIKDKKRIYLCLDMDEAGNEGCKKIVSSLEVYDKVDICYRIELPNGIKDAQEYLEFHTKQDFEILIQQAKKIDMSGIMTAIDAMSAIKSKGTQGFLTTQWSSINKLIKGHEPRLGEMMVMTAEESVGKTAICLNMATYMAKFKDVPTLVWCMESTPGRLAERIIQADRRVPNEAIFWDNYKILDECIKIYKDIPLYFVTTPRSTIEEVKKIIQLAVKRYGIKFVVFDNINFLIRDLDRMVQQTTVVSKEFKMLAVELNIFLILIAQPRKTAKNKDGKRSESPLTSDDIRDSKMIAHDAEYVVILHRKRKPFLSQDQDEKYEPETAFILEKARDGKTGTRYLNYHGEWTLFTELDRPLI